MAGVYIHIPFCKSRCTYCDFYSTVGPLVSDSFIETLCKEIRLRKDYLDGEQVETIYFGGGTPSLLQIDQVDKIIKALHSVFKVAKYVEVTLEANPDDLSDSYLSSLKRVGVNRLSIGIQSFEDAELELMARRHGAKRAEDAVYSAYNAGFENISLDLIYGLPNSNQELWKKSLARLLALEPEHISAYHLTYEEGTSLHNRLKKDEIKAIDEKVSKNQFLQLQDMTSSKGYIQYEISNFCLPEKESKHNSNYWNNKAYIGFGPAAHSYNSTSRQWNVSNLDLYVKNINEKKLFYESEDLTKKDLFNEYILTRLRTAKGADLSYIEKNFGSFYIDSLHKNAQKYLDSRKLIVKNSRLMLESSSFFISDSIISNLMIID
jgi:oxygen-independent coproporphyrinogen-3 oxidase